MTKMVPVRMSEELVARMDARTKNRSALIVEAVEKYLSSGSMEPEKMIIIKPAKAKKATKQPCDHHAIGDDEPESASPIEAEVEKPAVSGGCRKHPGAGGFPKAGGWWCNTCSKVV